MRLKYSYKLEFFGMLLSKVGTIRCLIIQYSMI